MLVTRPRLVTVFAWLAAAVPVAAQSPPSFVRQVKPFLGKYCGECHSGGRARGDLSVDSFKALLEGGKSGPAVVPGKPDESSLVVLVEHKAKPIMPPQNKRQPKPNELPLLRRWVEAGAPDDSATVKAYIPDIRPRVPTPAPVTALAYSPDGKLLAAGGHREAILIDAGSGAVVARLRGQTMKVTALAFSRDGRWLAVASGDVGTAGELRLYAADKGGHFPEQPAKTIAAHQDLIHDLAFSPDGRLLATCGYDRLIKLWDVAAGTALRVLKDHSDAVYGVAFSPDGRLLASAAADRAVKVWDVVSGRRLYTLGEATDWLYAVAWSPDGRRLTAGGVDKSLRAWDVTPEGGKLVQSVFAHEGAITRIVYAADGATLYSLSEDRTVKVWDAARMTERKVLPRQPDVALALALRPAAPQLALGRFDGVLAVLDPASGKVVAEPLPVKPKPPQFAKLTPDAARRGQTVRLTLQGKELDQALELTTTVPGATIRLLPEGRHAELLHAEITIPAQAPAGRYQITLKGPVGAPAQLPLFVDLFPQIEEKEPNNSPGTAQRIKLPVTVVGTIGQAGEVDFFRFEARAGQQVGVQALTAALGSKLEAVLQLTDPAGRVVAESTSGVLGHTCATAGPYALGIRDREYRGGKDFTYRLHAGDIPVVTAVFPLGLQHGQEADVRFDGVHLGGVSSVHVKADKAPGERLPIAVPNVAALGAPSLVVGEFPEVLADQVPSTPVTMPVPGTANGRIAEPGAAGLWRFPATKGQRLVVEVNARRLGSPLDSYLEILDAKGQPVPRAVLRSLARTYTTFRDHDSAGGGIRMEAWHEFAMNDYVWVGNELLRILALPRNPDDDCQFFAAGGQRTGYLDTTPTHLPLGTPMYKVEIHPPGTTFPPNGFPVIALPYRNDDGGPGYGKDSRLFFDPPADGDYLARITDARGEGGSRYAYRLTVRPPRPSYTVSFSPNAPSVWKGGAVPVSVTANRTDGYDGAIEVRLENLPAGFSAPATTIPAGENSTALALSAAPDASVPAGAAPLKLVARAVIEGQAVVREATGGVPKAVEPGDLVTTTEQTEITVRPGQEVRLTARVERRNGHTGRVPLDVRGLPHGVHVLDVGLNGILITEKESARTFAIYCEPWVQPTSHPIVVLARSERKGTEHAAKSVLLRVVK
jgi:WD40 repeat protein